MTLTTLKQRLGKVMERITDAAERSGRHADEITLVAVTKTWPVAVLLDGYAAGLRHFGENRPQEIEAKRPEVEATLGAGSALVWHYIGNAQSRHTQTIASFADCFHALDRLKIARRLSQHLQENGRTLPVLLEVNVSGEATKAGFDCTNWEREGAQRDALIATAATIASLPCLNVQGLMTMAPWGAAEADIRSVFRRTRELRDFLRPHLPQSNLSILSMGMTDDFDIAIEEGATHVRVGRALFGERHLH